MHLPTTNPMIYSIGLLSRTA